MLEAVRNDCRYAVRSLRRAPVFTAVVVLTPLVREALARVDKEQIVSVRNVMTLDDVVSEATMRHRFRAVLVGAFAVLAIAVAMVGLSGILAYFVQQRVRDFGVRRALGATTSDVLRLVAGSTLRIVALGAAIGLALSIMMGRLLVTMLFGVRPLDPTTFGFVTIVLALTSAAAAIGPAWRAARVDPASALRAE
jgi:putative ABC transport system permease protein